MVDVAVSRVIAAPPEAVWTLVSDPTRMGEWSPENTGAKWLGGATGPAVGAAFRGSNASGRMKWQTKATVTEFVPNEAFAFDVTLIVPVATWAYRLAPVEGGTEVTEEWTHTEPKAIAWMVDKVMGVKSRAEHNRVNMEATLEAIAAELE